MSRKAVYWLLAMFVVVGAILRIGAWRIEPPHHPDEYYQYIEPAWLRLTGMGVEPWEWRDGVRSWVLPAYNGAWMAFAYSVFGLSGGAVTEYIQLHWAFISLTLIWAGWRGGLLLARRVALRIAETEGLAVNSLNSAPLGWQGGLLGAGFCACFPLLVMQAPHTFSETPSMLGLVWSVVLALEAQEQASLRPAILAGLLASLGVCFRIANGPVAVLPFVILVTARNWRSIGAFVVAGIVPVVLFGLVDLATWGGFLSSYLGYIRFNFIEGRAARYGVSPGDWYWQVVIERLPTFIAILFVLIYRWRKVTWPYLAGSLGLLVYLTTQGHKEERFIILFWPFFFIAVAGVIGGWFATRQPAASGSNGSPRHWTHRRFAPARVQVLLTLLIVLLVSIDSLLHSARKELDITQSLVTRTDYSRGLVDAQAWVGKRPDLVGLVIQQMGGGYAWLGASAPMVTLDKNVRHSLVRNPALNYAIVMTDSPNEDLVKTVGYVHVRTFGNYGVYRKGSNKIRREDL